VTIPDSQVVLENFLGIRYALEPLGAQRFKPPVGVGMTKFTFNASEYGPMCIQVGDNMAPNESEDCLYLNVFRPAGTPSGQKLPVAVHFHGGSFVFGSGGDGEMAAMVAWSSEPIIGVSVNFRLGALGFLSSGLMARVGALNLGLQDQVAALKWVKQNIEGFGGDSGKVTIMGDSAGAHSVSTSPAQCAPGYN
jgi:acetylcholinesterase